DEFSDQAQYRTDLALTHSLHAQALLRRNRVPAARSAVQKAFEIQDQLARKFPEEAEYRLQAERYRFDLGNMMEEAGQTAQARAAYTQALDNIERLADAQTSGGVHHFI